MAAYYNVCDGITVVADEDTRTSLGESIGVTVQVTFPDSRWLPTTYARRFEAIEAAKDSARMLAASLKTLKPKGNGFYPLARLAAANPGQVKARESIEHAVKAWAGEDCTVVAAE